MTETATVTARWCLETDDRIGMIRDIVAEVAHYEGDVEAMEVVAHVVYMRVRIAYGQIPLVRSALRRIAGVKSLTVVDSLPFEADEQRLVKRVMQQDVHTSDPISFATLLYRSPVMQRIVEVAQAVANRDVPVLITGESGTGKELMARAIHQASGRSRNRFVPVNCAAIPDALLESELFGYSDGAFTGARRGGRIGLFELAHGGTLFLDEIGEMNPAVQAKLLRALSEGEIRRVGDNAVRKVDVRILAATNRDLAHLVDTEQFRMDLFYRLNVIPMKIPPLRDRKEDILPLAIACVERMSRQLERDFILSEAAMDALLAYRFPGNVRELQNMIERACYLTAGTVLTPEHLMLTDSDGAAPGELAADASEDVTLKERIRSYERLIIEDAIARNGSLRRAAKQLGVSHASLVQKRKQWQSGT